MNWFIIVDLKKCIGCCICEVVCVLVYNGGKLDILIKVNFVLWLKVVKGMNVSIIILCCYCEDVFCVNVCLNGVIVWVVDSIQVLQEKCIGCKICVVVCFYGVMNVVIKQVEVMFNGFLQGFCLKVEV